MTTSAAIFNQVCKVINKASMCGRSVHYVISQPTFTCCFSVKSEPIWLCPEGLKFEKKQNKKKKTTAATTTTTSSSPSLSSSSSITKTTTTASKKESKRERTKAFVAHLKLKACKWKCWCFLLLLLFYVFGLNGVFVRDPL